MTYDPLTNPPKLEPAKPVGEWDEDVGDIGESDEAEELVTEAEDQDPGDETEPEEVSEEDVVEEEEEPELVAKEEEAPPQGKRAEKRIQQLVQKNKDYESKLATALEKLAQAQQSQFDFQRSQFENVEKQRRDELEREYQLKALEESGFDPTDRSHQFLALFHQKLQEVEARQKRVDENLAKAAEKAEAEKAWNVYYKKLDGAFDKYLGDRELDAETKVALRDLALAKAEKEQLSDPTIAVQTVLKPYLKLLPKTSKTTPKAPVSTEVRRAHEAVSLRGPANTKKAGDKIAKRQPKASDRIQDALYKMYGESAGSEW